MPRQHPNLAPLLCIRTFDNTLCAMLDVGCCQSNQYQHHSCVPWNLQSLTFSCCKASDI